MKANKWLRDLNFDTVANYGYRLSRQAEGKRKHGRK